MRSLQPLIERDLNKRFVFLTGPRQVGKTYLSKQILSRLGGKYYNWDLGEDRQAILSKSFIHDGTVVLDEIHKYDRWKNFTKGVFDKFHEQLKILITGSARLDIYRRGGDSLVGRYFLFHLHPLSMGELKHPETIPAPKDLFSGELPPSEPKLLEDLTKLGGFPEPFYDGREDFHRRWSIQRLELLVRQDIRDLTHITHLSLVEHLLLLLPKRIASCLSINSLREELQVAYNTVRLWLDALERFYILFRLSPYTAHLSRSVLKEKKVYLWDWSQIPDEGARFENLVASHLFKAVQTWRDIGWGNFQLYFLRDRARREVDFCLTLDDKPWLLVEAKLSETQMSESLDYFAKRFQVPAIQIVRRPHVEKVMGPIRLVSADQWLLKLP